MNHTVLSRPSGTSIPSRVSASVILLATLILTLAARLQAQESVISGHIIGSDGRPPVAASLEIFRFGNVSPDTIVEAGITGGFSISLSRLGVYKIRISALHHESLSFPLICDRVMREEVDIRLAPLRVPRRIDSVCAIGTFNGYSLSAPLRMEFKEGAYRTKLRDVPVSSTWQVLVFGDTVRPNGIRTCALSKTGYTVVDGECAVRLDRQGATELRFDPSDIPQRSGQASITTGNAALQRFLRTAVELTEWRERYQTAMETAFAKHRRNGGDNGNFDVEGFRQRMGSTGMEEKMRERIRNAEDTLSEQLLYLGYLGLPAEGKDNALMERALRVIPPYSMIWSIDPSAMYVALNARKKDTKEQYINDVLATNPSESVIVPVAYSECLQAQVEAQPSRQRELYRMLVKKYPDHPLTVSARLYLNPDRNIKVGRTFPVVTMMPCGTTVPVSSSTFKGTYTLIDMRTDYCAQCDMGFKKLVSDVKTMSGKFIRAISLNLGNEAASIKEERTKNLLVQSARLVMDTTKDDAVRPTEYLEYVGYPWRVLLNEEMEIVAMGSDLDDAHFTATLRSLVR